MFPHPKGSTKGQYQARLQGQMEQMQMTKSISEIKNVVSVVYKASYTNISGCLCLQT